MKLIKRFLATLLAVCLALGMCACGSGKNEQTSAKDITTTEDYASASDNAASESDSVNGKSASGTLTTAPAESTTVQAKKPTTTAEILAEYTKVMNLVKSSKPDFYSYEYQELPKDKRNFDGFMMKLILPLASLFMSSKEKVSEDPAHTHKGDDAYWFPIYKTDYGCLLTDITKLKKAEFKELPDGKYQIILTLIDEMNPNPCEEGEKSSSSYTGAVLSPLKMSDIEDTIKNDGRINKLVKLNSYSLKYYDCSATLVYDPKTLQVTTLDTTMHVLVNLDGKIGLSKVNGSAVLDDFAHFYDFTY